MTRYSLVAVFVLLSFALTACPGGDEEAVQTTPAGQRGPPTTPTPLSTPIITDNLLEFEDKGYSVRFPEGWTPVPNFLPGPDFSVDAFFAPKEVEGVQPNIAVTCERLPEEMTLEEYVERKVEVVKQLAKVEPEVSPRKVSGQDALVTRFAREKNIAHPVEKTEVFLVTERCGWGLSLTVPYGQRTGYHGLFEEFLDSFRLLP